MDVQVFYCNHQTADLQVRERLAFSTEEQLNRAYERLRNDFPDSELVVLSTCNRIELYTAQEKPDRSPTADDLARFFSEFHAIPVDEFVQDLIGDSGPDAVRHLFQVASSIDSMVLGEPQIVSQVKEAYRIAQENDACGPLTHVLFQRAIRVSGRVRHETRLAEGRVSVASVAVADFGTSIFDHFDDKSVLVLGAGEMAEETLRYLKDEGVRDVFVVNRNPERAVHLAEQWGGHPKPIEELDHWLAAADVIVSTTGAEEPIVEAERFRRIRRRNGAKPVCILDLAAPRDFEPAVGEIDDNVFLYDIDDLEETCRRNRQARETEIQQALQIIDEETEQFMREVYHRATGPIIQQLRADWHETSRQEIQRLFNKLSHLEDKDRQTIERSIERIVNKLLHPPLETLRDEAHSGPPHSLVEALRRLFHLRD